MTRETRKLSTAILRLLLHSHREDCEMDVWEVFQQRSDICTHAGISSDQQLLQFLHSAPQVFRIFEDRGVMFVAPTTELMVCPTHSRVSGSCRDRLCRGLHVCIFYLLSGQCAFTGNNAKSCLFGHLLSDDPHNHNLLMRFTLGGLNLEELRRLFCLPRVRQGVTVPKICKYYNKYPGCKKMHCCAVHMCKPYLFCTCKFVDRCKRSHDIKDPQVQRVLTLYGVDVSRRRMRDILQELRSFRQDDDFNDDDSSFCSSDDEDENKEGRGRARTNQMSSPHGGRRARSAFRPRSNFREKSSSLQARPNSVTRKPQIVASPYTQLLQNQTMMMKRLSLSNAEEESRYQRLRSSKPLRATGTNHMSVTQISTFEPQPLLRASSKEVASCLQDTTSLDKSSQEQRTRKATEHEMLEEGLPSPRPSARDDPLLFDTPIQANRDSHTLLRRDAEGTPLDPHLDGDAHIRRGTKMAASRAPRDPYFDYDTYNTRGAKMATKGTLIQPNLDSDTSVNRGRETATKETPNDPYFDSNTFEMRGTNKGRPNGIFLQEKRENSEATKRIKAMIKTAYGCSETPVKKSDESEPVNGLRNPYLSSQTSRRDFLDESPESPPMQLNTTTGSGMGIGLVSDRDAGRFSPLLDRSLTERKERGTWTALSGASEQLEASQSPEAYSYFGELQRYGRRELEALAVRTSTHRQAQLATAPDSERGRQATLEKQPLTKTDRRYELPQTYQKQLQTATGSEIAGQATLKKQPLTNASQRHELPETPALHRADPSILSIGLMTSPRAYATLSSRQQGNSSDEDAQSGACSFDPSSFLDPVNPSIDSLLPSKDSRAFKSNIPRGN